MKMELSLDTPNLAQQFNAPKRQHAQSSCPQPAPCQPMFDVNDTIDIAQLNLDDEEAWLYDCPNKKTNLQKWLYEETLDDFNVSKEPHQAQDYSKPEPQKNIDTRTFTRPKKRFIRPSIEKYNEELYGSDCQNDSNSIIDLSLKKLNDSGIFMNGFSQDGNEFTPTKPLHFDLTQPTSSYYFENILANASNIDSFQNMSPPSLVNSMCSSTFANLMENSFIKNDPVLREIRDTDYTESILQQETEPLFQSITESCSSLNSDVPENFLKKVSFNETFRRSFVRSAENSNNSANATIYLDATFNKDDFDDSTVEKSAQEKTLEEYEDAKPNLTSGPEQLNGTYQRSPKLKTTFRISDVNNGTIKLNSTFNKRLTSSSTDTNPETVLNATVTLKKSPKDVVAQDLNSTVTLEPQKFSTTLINEKSNEQVKKRLLNRRERPSMDLNRLSYCVEKRNDGLNATFANETRRKNEFQRDSLSGSNDSTENLDYMSVSSGSSKGSNKMLNMDGINAIVEMQERSLQIMSTPKPNTKAKNLWDNHHLSPIDLRNSDPELSSTENAEIKTAISPSTIRKQKSMGHINAVETLQQGPNAFMGMNRLQAVSSNMRGSHPNLKSTSTNIRTSQNNLQRPSQERSSRSNLNTMGRTLKGSYTSLKPISANLPVAPPLNTTMVRTKTHAMHGMEGNAKIAQVTPMPRETKLEDAQFLKPKQPVRSSGLPRPMSTATGIPRPVSRIPGPRNVRSVNKPAGQQGRPSTYNYY